jgi:hypothetical protein
VTMVASLLLAAFGLAAAPPMETDEAAAIAR